MPAKATFNARLHKLTSLKIFKIHKLAHLFAKSALRKCKEKSETFSAFQGRRFLTTNS